MVKVKNVGSGIYADGVLFLVVGDVAEVSEQKAAYLLSDECPGKFEEVKAEAAPKQAKQSKQAKE